MSQWKRKEKGGKDRKATNATPGPDPKIGGGRVVYKNLAGERSWGYAALGCAKLSQP